MAGDNLPIKQLVVHVTDSRDDRDFTAADIRKWHVEERGWKDIGYHYVCRRNGDIEPGRKEDVIGAHVVGHNRHSLGIVWVGRDHIEPVQYLTLIHLVACLCRKHGLTEQDVKGHYEFPDARKTCPNLDMAVVRRDVASRLAETSDPLARRSCERTGSVCRCAFIGQE